MVLPETLRRTAPAERVIARKHHGIFEDTASENKGGGGKAVYKKIYTGAKGVFGV